MHTETDHDIDLVAPWLKMDKTRWLAGAFAGVFGGLLALAFGAMLAKMGGHEALFPVKIMALPFLGSTATEVGVTNVTIKAIVVGLVAFEALCAFWGRSVRALHLHQRAGRTARDGIQLGSLQLDLHQQPL